ncbi:MAG: CHAT domain-containing protein [Thermoanaerobaculia bacterium]
MTLRPARSFFLRASPLAIAGLLLSCSAPPAAPEVEYAGCGAFYSSPEPVCTLWPHDPTLKLWVKTEPGSRVEIRTGGQPVKAPGQVTRTGMRYLDLPLPERALSLSVTVYPRPGNGNGATWSLRIAKPDRPVWLDEIRELNPQEALRRLADLRRSAPRREQCWILGALAERIGNLQEKERLLRQRLALERAQHHWSGEVETATFLAHLYIEQGRFNEAAKILQELRFPPQAPADGKYYVSFNLGVLAERTGNYRAALKRLEEASDLTERVGMTKLGLESGQMLALLYQRVGRSQDASTLFARLQADLALKTGCTLGTFWTNVGWFRLMEHEVGNTAEDPVLVLQRALDEFEKNRCSSSQRLNAHLNLALAYQQQGQWSEAGRELAQARALGDDSSLLDLLWQDDLEARTALHEGRPDLALALYENLAQRSERAASPAGLLQALLGGARAHLASGQRRAAIDALTEADRQIEEQSRHIPIDQGRDTFFAYQEAATRLYLELLLEERQRQSAFNLARKSRSRLLRQLAVRDRLSQLDEEKQKTWLISLSRYHATRDTVDSDAAKHWQLAASEKGRALEAEAEKLKSAQEELDSALGVLDAFRGTAEAALSPPERGEVVLAYHPLPGAQWAAFAATERGIEVARFKLPGKLPVDPEERARILLAPSPAFRAAVERAGSVRVLPYGPLRTVDFHVLPFANGQPLLATHQVAYSLDLPRRSASTPRGGRPVALVVANPTRDLRAAETEGRMVAAAVERWPGGWEVSSLEGGAAQARPVRDALTRARFFHYAGHGSFGGFAGWGSELPLAERSRLTLSDVLALSHTPDSIVLSACDAGRTSEEAPGEGVGLANAFLLAGAREVVAARQSVPDASANELMTEMYRHWQPEEDLPHQLRRAQLACSRMRPSPCPSWANFRLLTP